MAIVDNAGVDADLKASFNAIRRLEEWRRRQLPESDPVNPPQPQPPRPETEPHG